MIRCRKPRHPPAKEDKTGGDGDVGYTVKQGQCHYGCQAPGAVDETHTLIRQVKLTAANVPDGGELENVVKGDEEMLMADQAYGSRERCEGCGRKGVGNGIWCKASRGEKLRSLALAPTICSIRFDARWKRCLAGGSGVPAGGGCAMWDANATGWNWSSMRVLEPETAGQRGWHENACAQRPPTGGKHRTPGTKAPRFSAGQIMSTLKNPSDIKNNRSNSRYQRSQTVA